MKRLLLLGMALWASGGCLLDDAGRGDGGEGGDTMSFPPCEADADCPDDPSICVSSKCLDGGCRTLTVNEGTPCAPPENACYSPGVCAAGQCVSTPLPDGAIVPDPPGNCQTVTCDETHSPVASLDSGDAPPASLCKAGICVGDKPALMNLPDGTGCPGGHICCNGSCCDADCNNCL